MTGACPGGVGARPRRTLRAALAVVPAIAALAGTPVNAGAQLTEPCRVGCALVLGASAYVVATGTMVAAGRVTEGLASGRQGARIWAGGFVAVVGAGLALGSNGARQERAIYASGVGALAGTAVGLVVGAARAGDDDARPWAGALIGAGAGALLGGIVGAVTHDGDASGGVAERPFFYLGWTF